MPILEVHTTTGVLVFMLALDDFNDREQRRAYLAGLGHRCKEDGHTVIACRFGSEAWMKAFTPEELASRGERQVETYTDRQEMIVVIGQMATGDTKIARAQLHRRSNGTVERLGTWEIEPYAQMRSPLLDAFWQGYQLATRE